MQFNAENYGHKTELAWTTLALNFMLKNESIVYVKEVHGNSFVISWH